MQPLIEMQYKDWNDSIAAHFFREDNAGKLVFLNVSQSLIRQLGKANGLASEECLDSFLVGVRKGYGYVSDLDVFDAAMRWLDIANVWEGNEDFPYPPYVAYLGLTVLAAGYNPKDEFSSHEYYPRLNHLLGHGKVSTRPQGFDRLHKAWEHLEWWANVRKRGELGIFETHRLDERAHVGVPRSQRLLTNKERRAVKWVYSQVGLDRARRPSEEELALLVRTRARKYLRPRTYQLLAPNSSDSAYRRVLVEALDNILETWDGTPVELGSGKSSISSGNAYRGTLVLNLVNSFGEFSVGLRCICRRGFPEGELVLEDEDGREYRCHEIVGGWSTLLEDSHGRELDATSFDWSSPVVLTDPDQDWTFTFRPSAAHVFVKGRDQGLPNVRGYVGSGQLPLGTPFYLIAKKSEAECIEEWGRLSCRDFELVKSGVFCGSWNLYHAESARDDKGVHGKYGVLTQPNDVGITLDGGVRVRPRANEYFTFAPPAIRVRGSEEVVLKCGDMQLEKVAGERFELPDHLRTPGEREVVAIQLGEVTKSKLFVLHDHTSWRNMPDTTLDKFGHIRRHEDESTNIPADVTLDPESKPVNFFPELLELKEKGVYLVGATPGQVSYWPSAPLPTEWQAVWAIPKNGEVLYCWPGESPPNPKSVPNLSKVGGSDHSRSKVNTWKEVLYHWRRRTKPPRKHVRLFMQYRDKAKNI